MKRKIMELFLAGVLLTMPATSYANNAINDIWKELDRYHWWVEVEDYFYKNASDHIQRIKSRYKARKSLVIYLEKRGLFQSPQTTMCKGSTLNKTCYSGDAEQNRALLKALQTPQVRDHLSTISTSHILGHQQVSRTPANCVSNINRYSGNFQ